MTHLPLLPILIPLTGAMLALFLRRNLRIQSWFSLGTLLTSLATSGWLLATVAQSGDAIVFFSGGWQVGGVPVGITLVGDLLAAFMVGMAQLVFTMGLAYAIGCNDKVTTYPTFYPIFLLLVVGLSGAMMTGDLFNLFVFAELLVIAGTVLTAIADDRFGTEAAFKYFYMSLLSAAFLLLACGALYISYGTLNLAQLGAAISAEITPLALIALGLLLATFMAKSATVPFHFWQPDFHAAAPTPVSATLSSVVVKLGVYGYLRITTLLYVEQADRIGQLLIIAGIVGIIFGGLAAIGTHNVKRMLAYSTLAQLGFVLVGIGWGTTLSIAAALVFAFNHALIKAAMLMLAGAVASRAPIKSADFSNILGVGKGHPFAGALFFIGALGLAGIPPTSGFVSKMLIFNSGIEAARFLPLAIIGVAAIFTLIYTMRAFMHIWFLPREDNPEYKAGDSLFAPAALLALVVLLGLWADPLVSLALDVSVWLDDPANYLTAVLGETALAMEAR